VKDLSLKVAEVLRPFFWVKTQYYILRFTIELMLESGLECLHREFCHSLVLVPLSCSRIKHPSDLSEIKCFNSIRKSSKVGLKFIRVLSKAQDIIRKGLTILSISLLIDSSLQKLNYWEKLFSTLVLLANFSHKLFKL
jgi:hypothetical protein